MRAAAPMSRRLTTPFTPVPRTHMLSNTQYHVMLTNAGSGVEHLPGAGRDPMARGRRARGLGPVLLHPRPRARDAVWSAGFQPVCRLPESYEVIFAADKATFRRRDGGIETVLEVIVSPEHRAEIRRVTLVNHDASPRELELTSYAEIVLAPRGADLGHPAFAKLFLETEWVPGPRRSLCRRRMRSATEQPLWAMHVAAVDRSSTAASASASPVRDRPGRGSSAAGGRPPTRRRWTPARSSRGPSGPVLDPIVSLRRRLRLEPGGSAVVALITAFAESRERGAGPGRPVPRGRRRRRAPSSWPGRTARSSTGTTAIGRGGAPVPAAGVAHRLRRQRLARRAVDRRRQPAWARPGLWRFGISGDRPIVLVADRRRRPSCRWSAQLLAAHAYLRLTGPGVRPGPARRASRAATSTS